MFVNSNLEKGEIKYEKKRNNTNNSNEITEEKRDLVNIIIKLHSHNRNIRETFYKEKIEQKQLRAGGKGII